MSFTTLDTAFQILDIFLVHERPMMAKEIARLTNLSRSGLYKYLASLKEHRYLEYSEENGTYRLGFKFLEFGRCVQQQLQIYEVAKPYMETLCSEVDLVVVLSALSDEKAYCVGRVGKKNNDFVYTMEPGVYMPLHCGASSLVLLAHLDDEFIHRFIKNNELKKYTENTLVEPKDIWRAIHRIRTEGCWYSDSEIGIGRAIGAPIFDNNKNILAVICIIGPMFDFTDDKVNEYKQIIISYANTISNRYTSLLS